MYIILSVIVISVLILIWERTLKINDTLNKEIYIYEDKNKINRANGIGYLKICPYIGAGYQNVHPSIIYFPKPWNGYNFWLAITPYRKEKESLENPCIMCSNDLFTWREPQKKLNPIVKCENVREYHYSDPQLVYTQGRLEMWYRKRTRGNLGNKEIILRKLSYNGIHWNDEEILYESIGTYDEAMCPVVIIESGKYLIWICDWKNKRIRYFESCEGDNWIFIRDINIIPIENRYVWHMDIKKTGRGYEMYFSAALNGYDNQKLAYSYSADNITWTEPVIVMEKGKAGSCDEDFLYKPTFVDIDEDRFIIYSARDRKKNWHSTMSTCNIEAPTELKGVIINSRTLLGED